MKLIKINTGLIMCEYSHNLEFFFFIFICLFILTFYEEHRDSLQAFLLKEKGQPDQTRPEQFSMAHAYFNFWKTS